MLATHHLPSMLVIYTIIEDLPGIKFYDWTGNIEFLL